MNMYCFHFFRLMVQVSLKIIMGRNLEQVSCKFIIPDAQNVRELAHGNQLCSSHAYDNIHRI